MNYCRRGGRRNLEALNCLLECRNRDGVAAIVIIGLAIGRVMMNIGGNGGDGGAVKSAVRGSREVAREEEKARRGVRTEEGGDDERERDGEDGHE